MTSMGFVTAKEMKQKILTLNSHVLAPKSKDGGIAQGGMGGALPNKR